MAESTTALLKRADRALVAMRNLKAKTRLNESRMYGAVSSLVGGAAAGAADAYMNEPKILGLPGVPMASAACLVVGMFDVIPGAEYLAEFGKGGLSYAVGSMVYKKVNEFEEE